MGDRLLLVPPIGSRLNVTETRPATVATDFSSLYNEETHPQDFELPRVVKSRIGADVRQANAFAVTTALFAGALLTLIQVITENGSKTAASQALRVITYCSVIINLTGTTLALIIIKMCTDLEVIAQGLIIERPSSWPARIARGEKLTRDLICDPYGLLEAFGMSKGYKMLDQGVSLWIIFGNLLTFASVIVWVYAVEDIVVAATTMVGVVPALLGLTFAFYINVS